MNTRSSWYSLWEHYCGLTLNALCFRCHNRIVYYLLHHASGRSSQSCLPTLVHSLLHTPSRWKIAWQLCAQCSHLSSFECKFLLFLCQYFREWVSVCVGVVVCMFVCVMWTFNPNRFSRFTSNRFVYKLSLGGKIVNAMLYTIGNNW